MKKSKPIKLRSLINKYLRYDYETGLDRAVCIHPSEIYSQYFCGRKLFYKANIHNAIKDDVKKNPDREKTFLTGNAFHDFFRDQVLGPSGLLYGHWKNKTSGEVLDSEFVKMPEPFSDWTYVEPSIEITELNPTNHKVFDVNGKVDGIILDPATNLQYVLDIKTSNSYTFDNFTGPESVPINYVVQLHFYMYALNIPRGILYFFNKDTGKDREVHIEYDPKMIPSVWNQRVKPLIEHYKNGTIPERNERCENQLTCSLRKECPYERTCFQ